MNEEGFAGPSAYGRGSPEGSRRARVRGTDRPASEGYPSAGGGKREVW